jgi:hypothetical protein
LSVSKWRTLDEWDPDHPAIVRMREALALRPVEPPDRPNGSGEAPDVASRRERIAGLVRRIEAGDLSAVESLRQLLQRE